MRKRRATSSSGWSARRAPAKTPRRQTAAPDGKLGQAPVCRESHFGLYVPESCAEVPSEVLDPRNTWSDKPAYDDTAREVAKRFESNLVQFEAHVSAKVKKIAIRAAA
jgi:phosphoenolpyruvate carboxykinase (ATP)